MGQEHICHMEEFTELHLPAAAHADGHYSAFFIDTASAAAHRGGHPGTVAVVEGQHPVLHIAPILLGAH